MDNSIMGKKPRGFRKDVTLKPLDFPSHCSYVTPHCSPLTTYMISFHVLKQGRGM